jgi:hypothetical protein
METLLSINRLLRSPGHGSNMPRSKLFSVGCERAECVEKRRRFH